MELCATVPTAADARTTKHARQRRLAADYRQESVRFHFKCVCFKTRNTRGQHAGLAVRFICVDLLNTRNTLYVT